MAPSLGAPMGVAACQRKNSLHSLDTYKSPRHPVMSDRKRRIDLGDQAALAEERANPGVNPFTGRQYSQKYYDILTKRLGELQLCVRHAGCGFRDMFLPRNSARALTDG